ncbi:probable LRR receptor-like serine/threonine-protein kinase At3g47570 [Asparagus officinalis]|uniref:probable LRR receptor-like serine/threonine-protein kinase At3g47570 n=1 Tax=Asparagus officinalis TaxID=4686 RepID=UPI00098E13E6|nr:probable LRR receptor-like serine/threonine-protein kinase At3g47570 [Asparagus officinalis]
MLPDSIANFSTNLQHLDMDNNYISGKISSDIGNLVNLMVFSMDGNLIYGSIPLSIGMLRKLNLLALGNNKLTGEIPSTIGNLTQLNKLYLDSNELSGNIPVSLGKCQNLIRLDLGSNKLTGIIPKEVVSISGLSISLSLASNSLSGLIPSEIGSLINVNILDFSMNKLSGEIPSTLSECQVLEGLYVGGNLFQGSIPSSLASLRGIQKLDFAKNKLSGKIPDFLQDFHGLDYLNLSFNNFEGEVPLLGVFANASAVSVIGNSKLCGGNPEMHLPACPSEPFNKKHHSRTVIVICGMPACPSEPFNKKHHSRTVIVICGSTILLIFVILLFCFLVVRCHRKGSRINSLDSSPTIEQNVKVTYGDLVRATNGFSEGNIIGTGSFGTVYKGLLDGESRKVVAVKVLNLQIQGASRTFIAECDAVKNIRHRNILKILTICSGVDFKGNDFKAVVFEFMENGSLDDWLHPKANEQSKPKKLNLMARLDIAIDVAYALDYLHHQCGKPIVHCDLKPSNILLDYNIIAHVGDFGLAKFLKKVASQYSTSSAGLRGTIGYIAPEYGMGNEVSTCGDVYSYGILLLEMFTGKRPTDDMFVGGLTLPMFVKMAFPEQITDVIEAHLLTPSDDAESMNYARATNCMATILRIGISCSNELPAERMETDKIIKELHIVRDMLMRNGNYGERQRVLQSGEGPSTNNH